MTGSRGNLSIIQGARKLVPFEVKVSDFLRVHQPRTYIHTCIRTPILFLAFLAKVDGSVRDVLRDRPGDRKISFVPGAESDLLITQTDHKSARCLPAARHFTRPVLGAGTMQEAVAHTEPSLHIHRAM